VLFALLLSLLWSGNPLAIKIGLLDAPPLRLGWLRFVVGGAVVLLWGVATRADLRPRAREWAPMALLGVLFSAQLACMNVGLSLTSAGHGAVLNLSFPIWVAVFAHFFIPGDRLGPRTLLGLGLAYGGILAFFAQALGAGEPGGGSGGGADGPSRLVLGDALSALSGLLLGARQVYNARVVQRVPAAKLLLAQAVCGVAAFVVASLLVEPDPWRWTGRLALSVFYQGVVIAGFGFVGNLWLLARYYPSQVSVLSLTQPVFSVLGAWLLLREPLTPALGVSTLLVTLGAGLVQARRPPQREVRRLAGRSTAARPGVACSRWAVGR
jgi:drug/metabolite transporter (DMT)-like permease